MSGQDFEHEAWRVPLDLEYAMGLSQLGGWLDLIGRWLCTATPKAPGSKLR